MNPALSGASSTLRRRTASVLGTLDSSDSARIRTAQPCNWTEGGFPTFDDEDPDEDVDYNDDDAVREYSSTSGSDSDEQERRNDGGGMIDEDRGNAEEIVINAVTRHVSVTMQVYTRYYNATMRGAARRDWARHSLPTMVRKEQSLLHRSHAMNVRRTSSHSDSDSDTELFTRTKHEQVHADEQHLRRHLWRESSILGLPIIPPDHMLSVIWGIVMLVLDAVYSSFVVPLAAAFCFHPQERLSWCTATEFAVGPIFILNVLFGFHVGFVISCNLRKMYIMRAHLVARFYVAHGGFWLDLLGVLAFVLQVVTVYQQKQTHARVVVRLLLILRIVRVYRLLTVMLVASVSTSSGKDVSTLMSSFGLYAMTLFFTAAFFINTFACLFFIVADIEGLDKSWLGRYNSSYGPGTNVPQEVLNASGFRHWQLGVYYVTTTLVTVGYGDITPATTAEQIMAVVMMLTAACMFAVLISSISEALSSLTADARTGSAVRKKLGEVVQWMTDRNIGPKDRRRIMTYYSNVWRQHHKEYETEIQIFEELPNVLRAKVAKALVRQLLVKSIVLPSRRNPSKLVHWNLHPAHVDMLAERFVPVEIMPGHELFTEGEDADNVYLLEEGRLEVWQNSQLLYIYENPIRLGWDEDGKPVTELRSQWIGNSSILGFFNIPNARRRPCSVRAQVSSKLWRLELESLKPVMRTQLEFVKLLIRIFRYSMVQALQSQPDRSSSCIGDVSRHDKDDRDSSRHYDPSHHNSMPAEDLICPEALPFKWNEFHAFMRIEPDDVKVRSKVAQYRKWAEQLEKAKTRQIIDLLSLVLAASPIANEMNDTQDALDAAKENVQNALTHVATAPASTKSLPVRPPMPLSRKTPALTDAFGFSAATASFNSLTTHSRASSASSLPLLPEVDHVEGEDGSAPAAKLHPGQWTTSGKGNWAPGPDVEDE